MESDRLYEESEHYLSVFERRWDVQEAVNFEVMETRLDSYYLFWQAFDQLF